MVNDFDIIRLQQANYRLISIIQQVELVKGLLVLQYHSYAL